METIYLIQPLEFIGTKTYKIGRSSKNDLSRCKNGYKTGTRFLCISECINSHILENNIKKEFNKLFKLTQGLEYFEGNEKQIYQEFVKLVIEHKNKCDDSDSDDSDSDSDDSDSGEDINIHKYNNHVKYTCDICNKTWKNKTDFARHQNKKKACKKDASFEKIKKLEQKIIKLKKKNMNLEKHNIDEMCRKNIDLEKQIIILEKQNIALEKQNIILEKQIIKK